MFDGGHGYTIHIPLYYFPVFSFNGFSLHSSKTKSQTDVSGIQVVDYFTMLTRLVSFVRGGTD